MARRLIGSGTIPTLSLDEITWVQGTQRRTLEESLGVLQQFLDANDHWVIEGCYGDLVEAALPYCTELRFLNPGIDTCIAHCISRPWEPAKFASPEEQHAMLDNLLEWVRQYETRDDDYGLKRHRRIFDQFQGAKREYTDVSSYVEG